jgi:hypothetical protein
VTWIAHAAHATHGDHRAIWDQVVPPHRKLDEEQARSRAIATLKRQPPSVGKQQPDV